MPSNSNYSLKRLSGTYKVCWINDLRVEHYMIPGFEKVVEERIRIAQKKGEFDNLPCAGQPLIFGDDRFIPEELRLAYKILKNADCVPPEIEIKKEINRTESLLSGMPETAEAYHLLKKLNFLVMKLNSLRDGQIAFEMPQQYQERLVRKFGKDERLNVERKK